MLSFVQKFLNNFFIDIYNIFAAIILFHFGANWLTLNVLFIFAEICETLACYFFFFFILTFVIFYRNFLFSVYTSFFAKNVFTFNAITFFFKHNIFFSNLRTNFRYKWKNFKFFFKNK